MSNVPSELKYMESHEWVLLEGDTATVGISDHAQELLGDLVFVELPEVGATVDQGDSVAVVESVKAASDIYAPLTGEIIEINEQLDEAPETINEDAFGDGWMFKMKINDEDEMNSLMEAEAYAESIEED